MDLLGLVDVVELQDRVQVYLHNQDVGLGNHQDILVVLPLEDHLQACQKDVNQDEGLVDHLKTLEVLLDKVVLMDEGDHLTVVVLLDGVGVLLGLVEGHLTGEVLGDQKVAQKKHLLLHSFFYNINSLKNIDIIF